MRESIGTFLRESRYLLAILVGIIAGTLIANTKFFDIADRLSLFNYEFTSGLVDMTVNYSALWQYILRTRIKNYTILLILLITPFTTLVIYTFLCITGISVGMILSVIVMNMGAMGIAAYLFSILPQYILYITAVSLMIKFFSVKGRNIKKTAVLILITLMCVLIGTYCEAYINPVLLKMFLEHFSYRI